MKLRVIVPLLLAVAAAIGLVVGGLLPSSGKGAAPTITNSNSPTGSASATNSPSQIPSPSATGRSNFKITKLASGQRPPQFVVVSFDGACRDELWKHYLALQKAVGAEFTFFFSGLCVVPDRQRFLYHPPHKAPGTSSIGFGTANLVMGRITNLTAAYNAGNEIGTHFLGHFCDANGVDIWNSADWRSEMTQFSYFLDNWATINGVTNGPTLPFTSAIVKGDRTPCLAGKRSQYLPVFQSLGWRYDASGTGSLRWPAKIATSGPNVGVPVPFTTSPSRSLWEFPLQEIQVVGYGRSQLSMDYNFLYAQNNAQVSGSQAVCDRARTSTYNSFLKAFNAVYTGNRAPLILGNHFNTWLCGAYRDALTNFITTVHQTHPDVQFISFIDLANWLDAQSPTVLTQLRGLGSQSE
jgi:hypothetical protein